jgi:hypothetical protein
MSIKIRQLKKVSLLHVWPGIYSKLPSQKEALTNQRSPAIGVLQAPALRFLRQLEHFVDQTIFYGFFGAHKEVALGIPLDALQGLTCMMNI